MVHCVPAAPHHMVSVAGLASLYLALQLHRWGVFLRNGHVPPTGFCGRAFGVVVVAHQAAV